MDKNVLTTGGQVKRVHSSFEESFLADILLFKKIWDTYSKI